MEVRNKVRSVAHDLDVTKITVVGIPDRPGIAASLFGNLAEKSIAVDMIVQNVSEEGLTDISITVNSDAAAEAERIMIETHASFGARRIMRDDNVAKVSVVGIGMKSQAGVAARAFAALARDRINIQMISTSEISISVIVVEGQADEAIRSLHREFIA